MDCASELVWLPPDSLSKFAPSIDPHIVTPMDGDASTLGLRLAGANKDNQQSIALTQIPLPCKIEKPCISHRL
jgi:hypothetical protein